MTWELQRLLRSQDAGELLRSALASAGLHMQSWRLERVYSRPRSDGRSAETSAKFQVVISNQEVSLVASTRQLDHAQRSALGAVRCQSSAGELHVWAHPADPELPGLAVVEDPALLAQRLTGLLGTSITVESVTMLVLRPLRRAVYRVQISDQTGERTVFVKVLRPTKTTELLQRHRACSLAPSAADAGDGLVVITAATGRSLTELLYLPTSPQPGMRIDPHVVLSALDSLSVDALELSPRQPPTARHRSFIESLVISGADRQRMQRLADAIDANVLPTPGPVVPTHGDFHPANLFLTADGSEPTALIDTDTIGPGFRADDAAMFVAHLLALPSFDDAGYADTPALVSELWDTLRGGHDTADLAARVAAALVSLAPGARSPQQLEHYVHTAESFVNCDK